MQIAHTRLQQQRLNRIPQETKVQLKSSNLNANVNVDKMEEHVQQKLRNVEWKKVVPWPYPQRRRIDMCFLQLNVKFLPSVLNYPAGAFKFTNKKHKWRISPAKNSGFGCVIYFSRPNHTSHELEFAPNWANEFPLKWIAIRPLNSGQIPNGLRCWYPFRVLGISSPGSLDWNSGSINNLFHFMWNFWF